MLTVVLAAQPGERVLDPLPLGRQEFTCAISVYGDDSAIADHVTAFLDGR